MIAPGSSFRWVDDRDGGHLWFVISSVKQNPDELLIVNVTSRHRLSDTSCILNVGDHEFIKNESCIAYYKAATISLASLVAAHSNHDISIWERADTELLDKLLEGARTTKFLKTKYKDMLQDQRII
ncbi:MAG: hypothetical protein M3552_07260 [Planctomycetota bacterium]|nr:hypothetical protein [Planctomycetota bacterium]